MNAQMDPCDGVNQSRASARSPVEFFRVIALPIQVGSQLVLQIGSQPIILLRGKAVMN